MYFIGNVVGYYRKLVEAAEVLRAVDPVAYEQEYAQYYEQMSARTDVEEDY